MNLRTRRLGASLAVAVLATTLTGVAASGSVAGEPSLPQLYSGGSPDGADITSVELYAVPPSDDTPVVGETYQLLPVDAQVVQTGSEVAIYADPDSIPTTMRYANGVVDFTAFLKDANGTSWTVSLSGRAVHTPSDAARARAGSDLSETLWLDPGGSSSFVSANRARDRYPIMTRAALAEDDWNLAFDDESVEVPVSQYVEADAPTPEAGGDPQDCLKETFLGDRNRSTTIATSYPIGESTSWVTHNEDKASESTLGIAMGYAGDDGEVKFKANGTKFTSSSWAGEWDPSGNMRSYRIQVNYHHTVIGQGCHGSVYYWKPHIETGGASTNRDGLSRPDWNTYCAGQPRNYTFHRTDVSGNAYEYGAAVKFKSVIDIDLSIKREYKGSQALHYYFSSGVKHRLCGNNDYPSMAGKMIDRYDD